MSRASPDFMSRFLDISAFLQLSLHINGEHCLYQVARLVKRLARGWTIRERDFAHSSWPPVQCVPILSPGVKRPGSGVNHPSPRLKKE